MLTSTQCLAINSISLTPDSEALLIFDSPTFLLQMKPRLEWQSSTFQNPAILEVLPTIITQSNVCQAEKGTLVPLGCIILMTICTFIFFTD